MSLAHIFIAVLSSVLSSVLLVLACNRWIKGRPGLWLCRVMGWHPGPYITTGHDGASEHAKCRRCGFEGMVDSQGNLF